MIRTFELGGLVIPVQAAGDISQTFETIGGFTLHRMLNGAGVPQSHWRKLKTTITGSGWTPPGLAGLDYDATHVLKSVAARSLQATGNVITVPAARRTDTGYAPTGYAIVDGRYVPTPLVLVTNTATLAAVAGAQGYGVRYWPQITVYARFSDDNRPSGASWNWRIEAEEI
ncbi:MAG: hypothetical protein ABS92_06795 [Thiobacillus sp. SCN 63-374]|nr:MAG: hypothetical protein ABS92_06795 [Thiobacillus sp. SCN 63-374]